MGAVRGALWALLCSAALAQGTTPTSDSPPPTLSTLPAGGDGAARSPLALRKCCALDELLDNSMDKCVPLRRVSEELNLQESILWWMDAKVRVAPSGEVRKLSDLPLNATVLYKKRPCTPDLTAVLWTKEASLYLNGSLLLQPYNAAPGKSQRLLLPPEDYCIDKTLLNKALHLAFLACPCNHVTCVRKCCDMKRMLTISEAIAMKQEAHCKENLPSNYTWNAPFVTHSAGSERRQANVSYVRLRGPFPDNCPAGRMNVMFKMSENSTSLLPNGTLVAKVTGSPFEVHQFCVDYGIHNNEMGALFAYICAKIPDQAPMGWKNYVYVVLYLVGLAALLATLTVYALLPDLRRPVHAKALMCHAAALAAALLTLAVSECVSASSYAACASLAFFGQFFLLAAFFWLTVLCFDFTRGLRDLLPCNDARSATRRLLLYSLFAWSGPTIIVAVTVSLNYAPGLPGWVQRPEIGKKNCWFSPTWAKFYYHYGPVACLLLANAGMFAYTMLRLRAAQQSGRGVLKNEDSCLTGGALRKRRERLLLYAKLFALMGVTWLLEVVVWAVGADEITMTFVDAVNVLRGVGVFAACCCKRNVIDQLRDRLPCLGERSLRHSPSSYTDSTDVSRASSSINGTRLKRIALTDDEMAKRPVGKEMSGK